MRRVGILFLAVLLFVTGCAPSTFEIKNTFPKEQAAHIHEVGPNKISGQIFMTRRDGIVVYGAGREVVMVPITNYSSEWITNIYGDKNFVYNPPLPKSTDPAFEYYTKKTTTDGQGNFVFENVSNGGYHLVSSVVWMAGDIRQGGGVRKDVTVTQDVNVILNGQ